VAEGSDLLWIVVAAEADHRCRHHGGVTCSSSSMRSFNRAGTSLVFAELKEPVRAKLERYELIGPLDPAHFIPHPRCGARTPIASSPAREVGASRLHQ